MGLYYGAVTFLSNKGILQSSNMISSQPANIRKNLNFILCNSNHKRLGLYYLSLALLFGISGTLCSLILRCELYSSGNRIILPENQNFYNLSFTLHGILMIFFLVMPSLYGGFGNYFIPLLIAAPEVGFPRINSFSLLLMAVSYGCIILSTTSEFGGATGWTLYPPLSTSLMSLSPVAVDVIIIGLAVSGIASFLSSINFLATIFLMRSLGVSLGILPLSCFSILITAGMLIFTLPILSGGLVMLLSDLHFNTIFFASAFSGDPVFYQHLFWFFGHPEVYILILPAFGICSQGISLSSQNIIFGNQSMVLAMGCISILGSVVWGHHIYTVGLEADTRAYFTAITIIISLPTGTKVFNWASTIMGCTLQLSMSSSLLSFIFLLFFSLGGTTGVILGNAAVDVALHDTYYVVAHFHLVLSLGAIIALFFGIFSFKETLFGSYSLIAHPTSVNPKYHFFLTIFGINLTFIPIHFLGFHVMPRRIPDFPDFFISWNVISSLGSGLTFMALSVFILFSIDTFFYRNHL
jgi:cytochrome c oxidase subunit 1